LKKTQKANAAISGGPSRFSAIGDCPGALAAAGQYDIGCGLRNRR
jgi:hypothetical protein